MSIYKLHRQQIKKSILDTAVLIYKQKGYENTTIDEITRTVGIAKGTFYNFYESKSEILLEWAAQKFQTVRVQEAFNNNNSLKNNLYKFVEVIINAIKDEEQLYKAFLKEVLHSGKKYNSQFDFIKIYRLILENSNDSHKVAGPLLDTKIVILNNSLFMGIVDWFDAGKPVEGLYEHLLNIVEVCLYGMLGDAGREK